MTIKGSESSDIVLALEDLTLSFGGVEVVSHVNLEIEKDKFWAIIGPNGSGKTCILNCINNFYHPQEGKIYFMGREITHLSSTRIARLGISRTFQNIELYAGLSVVDNILAARHIFFKTNILATAIYFGWAQKEEAQHRRKVEEIIDFLDMEAIRHQIVGLLPYGQRKKVELARSLALEPKLLLLDEPMAGMNLEEKEDLSRYILDIYEYMGITPILVEHDMGVVMDIVDKIAVLDFGRLIAQGTREEIQANPKVIDVYLGKEEVTAL